MIPKSSDGKSRRHASDNRIQCPATTRHVKHLTAEVIGIQCKYNHGHSGDHAGYVGYGYGDIFWAQEGAQ